jgi:hypothetical protein
MSAPKPSTVNPLLLQRQKTMEANVAHMQDIFKQKGHAVGVNKQDFHPTSTQVSVWFNA